MKQPPFTFVIWILSFTIAACQQSAASASQDRTGPSIEHIETSAKVLAKSDCQNTSERVTAEVMDESKIKQIKLWYRVGADQKYTPVNMNLVDHKYSVTVNALDTLGGEYGTWEFYITAEDSAGNKSQSPLDTSVQLLACVG
jgi:hypothetical protein